MLEKYICSRGALPHTARAIAGGKITIGFVGGSITEPVNGKRWSDKVADWFVFQYPQIDVNVENAAKGATGSLSAVFRVDEDILRQECDLVFVETAVNDGEKAWGGCREGLLRKLLSSGRSDVVLVYTFCQGMYDSFLRGELPPSTEDWEQLAAHYGISGVFSGKYAFDLTAGGFMRWEEWLPDGLHPEHAGSRIYAEPVCELLKQELARNEQPQPCALPAPLNENHWQGAYILDLNRIRRRGAWRLVRERRLPTAEYILYTASVKSSLELDFKGRGVVLRLRVNSLSAGYRYRVDQGEWVEKNDPLPEWGARATDWIREDFLMEDLPDAGHHLEIETMFAPNAKGSNFELCTVGIIR